MLSPRTTLGSFYLVNVDRKKPVLCRNFIVKAQGLDETQRQNAKNMAVSDWLKTLNMAIENAQNEKSTRYAADIDVSLFTRDSSNPWWVARARVSVSSVTFVFSFYARLVKPFLCLVSCCREISGFRKSFHRGDGVSVKDQCRGVAMAGVNTSQIMLGLPGSMTGYHVENFNFASVNYTAARPFERGHCHGGRWTTVDAMLAILAHSDWRLSEGSQNRKIEPDQRLTSFKGY